MKGVSYLGPFGLTVFEVLNVLPTELLLYV